MPDALAAPQLSELMLSKLAREIARNIVPLSEIRQTYQLSEDQFDAVLDNNIFKQRLAEELAIWNASDPMQIANRIGAKAATMIEESLSEVYLLIHDRTQPMSAKVEALKWAARMAGMGENPNVKNGADADRLKITINIGGNKLEFDKQRVLPAQVIDGEAVDLTDVTAR